MSLTLPAWATSTDQPAELELVLDPDRAAHRLDAALDLDPELQDQPGKAILIGGDHALALDPPASLTAHQAARR